MNRPLVITVVLLAALVLGVSFYFSDGDNRSGGTGAALVQVKVPDLTGDAKSGESLFDNKCASCHGKNAAGQDGVAPPLVHIIYEPNHHGDASFQRAAQNGVRAHHWRFGNMPPVEGIAASEVEKIIAYVRTLQRANGIN